jgi:hypothetical protein
MAFTWPSDPQELVGEVRTQLTKIAEKYVAYLCEGDRGSARTYITKMAQKIQTESQELRDIFEDVAKELRQGSGGYSSSSRVSMY